MMKNSKGVTLLAMVITIVIIIILAAVALYYGSTKNIDTTTSTRAFNEIFEVSEAASQRRLMNGINSEKYPLVGTALTDSDPVKINGLDYGNGWYRLKASEASELELENIVGEYVVNYKTGEVVSLNAIVYEDKEYFSSVDIRNVTGGGYSTISEEMFNAAKGVNRPYLVSGMIPVRSENGKWIITNADDERWYDYSSEDKAWANIMLADEITISGYTNEQVRTTPISEFDGLEVTTNGSMFVWIPRYTSNAAGDVMYSHLCEDYLEEGFKISPAFTDDSGELTGIWISKYDAGLSN